MSEVSENDIEQVIQVIDRSLIIKIPRPRTDDVIQREVTVLANRHLQHLLKPDSPQIFVKDSYPIFWDPPTSKHLQYEPIL
jgi:hypothetical protein